jgi:hypothetical protein
MDGAGRGRGLKGRSTTKGSSTNALATRQLGATQNLGIHKM